MGSIGTPELIVILVIALVIFGPGKLPEVGKAIGKGINELIVYKVQFFFICYTMFNIMY